MTRRMTSTVKESMFAMAALGMLSVAVFFAGCGEEPAAENQGTGAAARQAAPAAGAEGTQVHAAIVQKTCPIMGSAIDETIFVEYEGKKVYFCCKGCPEKFLADPAKYVAKLPQFQP